MVKNRIAQFRRENGMNQRELGEKLGLGQTTISAWETGRNEPDSDSLGRMAKLFHTTIGYLMGYEPESYLHGLTSNEYTRIAEKRQLQRDIEHWQRQNEFEQQGLTEEEIEEYQLAVDICWRVEISPFSSAASLCDAIFDRFYLYSIVQFAHKDNCFYWEKRKVLLNFIKKHLYLK